MSRRTWLVLGGIAVAGAVFVLVWFQPQALLFDVRVDEALPTGSASRDEPMAEDSVAEDSMGEDSMGEDSMGEDSMGLEAMGLTPDEGASPSMPVAEPRVTAEGTFVSRSHPTSGTASVVELPDGQRILRLEEFATDNGPDLLVYLSTAPVDAPAQAFDDDFIDLGRLKGNIGDQNYEIPEGVDLAHYRTAVIWCRRFTVVFGVADLAPI